MRTIVHMSDLHFGRVDETVLGPMISVVERLKPDVVAISGDLTQRARSKEFKQARAFLDMLPSPKIVVPGNHDVPLYNVFKRFLSPLAKYQRYISYDLDPYFEDEEISVLGVNTARSLTLKEGRINQRQVARIATRFKNVGANVIKTIVTHHPFDLPESHHASSVVGRAHMAMKTLAQCGVDVLLAGHLHVSHTGHTAKRYKISGHSALVIQAGTATSTRSRGEANSFNAIRVDGKRISIERLVFVADTSDFCTASRDCFEKIKSEWVRVPQTDSRSEEIRHTAT